MNIENLFDQLYNADEKTQKAIQKPLLLRKLKRQLESAYDDAGRQIIEAEQKLLNSRKNLNAYNINEVICARQDIQAAKEVQLEIKNEYSDLFAIELTERD